MKQCSDYRLVLESPTHYQSREVQEFINEELCRPNKRWVFDILDGIQETEHIKLETDEFVLLPDTERPNFYNAASLPTDTATPRVLRSQTRSLKPSLCPKCMGLSSCNIVSVKQASVCSACNWNFTPYNTRLFDTLHLKAQNSKLITPNRCVLNWLVIIKNRSIKTIRDLDASHVSMLERVKAMCVERVEKEIGVEHDEIMFYVHYHPSIYQLHIHVAYPYMQNTHRDIYRIHSLDSIINNLTIDPEYYKKATLQVSVSKDSLLYSAIKT